MSTRVITLLTDFGSQDAYVGIMKGVMLGICPGARLVDLTHAIPPQRVALGAVVLRSAVAYFPPDTVHVAVVDPGVGGVRRPIVIETERGVLVGPDNGLLAPAAALLGRRTVRVIDNPQLMRQPVSRTFHGRDVFAPAAAHLANGTAPAAFGPAVDDLVEPALPEARAAGGDHAVITGAVIYVDHFGNLITNIAGDALARFPGDTVSVSINDHHVTGLVPAYASVPEGTALAIIGSWGVLEIAVRDGSAARTLGVNVGAAVTVRGGAVQP